MNDFWRVVGTEEYWDTWRGRFHHVRGSGQG